jgi:hypothetical protein
MPHSHVGTSSHTPESDDSALNARQAADSVLEAVKKLEGLGALRQGWDSYGGYPLRPEARDCTLVALGWMKTERLPTPSVVLGSGGTVQLEWRCKGKELDVHLGTGDCIEYVTVDAQGNVQEGREYLDFQGRLSSLATWLLQS